MSWLVLTKSCECQTSHSRGKCVLEERWQRRRLNLPPSAILLSTKPKGERPLTAKGGEKRVGWAGKIVLLGAARRYPAWRAAAAVRAAQGAHGASRAGLDEQEGLQVQEVLAQQSRREQSSQSQQKAPKIAAKMAD